MVAEEEIATLPVGVKGAVKRVPAHRSLGRRRG
jgi:hypothetical protein